MLEKKINVFLQELLKKKIKIYLLMIQLLNKSSIVPKNKNIFSNDTINK